MEIVIFPEVCGNS